MINSPQFPQTIPKFVSKKNPLPFAVHPVKTGAMRDISAKSPVLRDCGEKYTRRPLPAQREGIGPRQVSPIFSTSTPHAPKIRPPRGKTDSGSFLDQSPASNKNQAASGPKWRIGAITEKRQRGAKPVQFAGGEKFAFLPRKKILKTHGDIAWEMDIPQKRTT